MKKSKFIVFIVACFMMIFSYMIEYYQYRLSNQQGNIYFSIFAVLFGYFIVIPVLNSIYVREATKVSLKNTFLFEDEVVDYLYKTVNNSFYDKNFLTDIFYLRDTIEKCSGYYVDLVKMIKHIFMYVTYIGILLFVTPQMVFIFLGLTAVLIVVRIIYAFREIDELIYNVSEDKDAEYFRDILIDPEKVHDIKIYDYCKYIVQKSIKSFEKGIDIIYFYRLKNALICPMMSALLYIFCGIAVISSIFISGGNLGSGVVAISCTLKMLFMIEPLADTIVEVVKKRKKSITAKKIISQWNVTGTTVKKTYSDKGIVISDIKSIRFCDVCFSYDGQNNVIENLDFEWKCGESVCILGENGSGKSTFLNLLTGVNKPTSGQIFINNINLENIDYRSYIKQLAVCSQDFAKFKDTVENNILLGRTAELTEKQYSKIGVGADQIIGSDVFENGIELSGGQWQKIAIMRAYVNMINNNLIIFDEPTAAVDIYSEVEFFDTLRELIKEKDAIFVTHRVGYATMADKICVMSKGKIVESGSEYELKSRESLYEKMYVKQGGLYV